ncbi:hypothetical protein [Spongiactinospora gelatinilytica]|nr:hypothetical protein [Spongiactinospora gelatinilytica]
MVGHVLDLAEHMAGDGPATVLVRSPQTGLFAAGLTAGGSG